MCNIEETLSTLDYAHKAKSIRNKPEINQKLVKKALIKEYTEEIDRLKRELFATRDKNGIFLPPEIFNDMESRLVGQKEEIRELNIKISALNDELEKINELFRETSSTLDQRNEQLSSTERDLAHTKRNLEQTQKNYNETRHLLDHRVINENKLLAQANGLVVTNWESQSDNLVLHEKIARLNSKSLRNREILNDFGRTQIERIENTGKRNHELSRANKERMINLSETLSLANGELAEGKEAISRGVHLSEEKLQNWLDQQQNLIAKEIQLGVETHTREMQHTLEIQAKEAIKDYENCEHVCNEHQQVYNQVALKIGESMEKLDKNVSEFDSKFSLKSDEFLLIFSQDINDSCKCKLQRLDEISEWIEDSKNEIAEIKKEKESIKLGMNKALKTIKAAFETVFTSLNTLQKNTDESLGSIAEKVDYLNERNDFYSSEIQRVKESIQDEAQEDVKKMNAAFEKAISAPVKSLVEFNASTIMEVLKHSLGVFMRNGSL
jgi:kinesin family protein 11